MSNNRNRSIPALVGRHPQTKGHVETIWILAALSLPQKERIEAMQDIADMLGTSYAMVQGKASRLKATAHAQKTDTGLPAGGKAPFTKTAYIPSEIRQLTKAELMIGKAR